MITNITENIMSRVAFRYGMVQVSTMHSSFAFPQNLSSALLHAGFILRLCAWEQSLPSYENRVFLFFVHSLIPNT